MKKIAVLVFLTIVVFTFSKIDFKSDMAFDSAKADTTDLNPNGSSELSLLMREMTAHVEQAKKDVMEKKLPRPYPVSFDKLKTARPTDIETKKDHYDAFADLYLSAVRAYSASTKENLSDNYHNLVSSCIACHTTHCPGPMVRIKKLPIDSK